MKPKNYIVKLVSVWDDANPLYSAFSPSGGKGEDKLHNIGINERELEHGVCSIRGCDVATVYRQLASS